MPIERTRAQCGSVQHGGDAEPANPVLFQRCRCRCQDLATNPGIGGQFVASPRARNGRPVRHVTLNSANLLNENNVFT